MSKIALIIDSTCSLPERYIEHFPIKVARLKVIYKEAEYTDGIDITPSQVYSHLEQELPTTSMPTVDELNCIYEELIEEGYTHVIGLPISSGLSGTINSFRIASENYSDRITSYVFDFKHLSMAIGLNVIKLAEMIQSGVSFDEICAFLPTLQANTHMFFTVETLEYLIKGGRIGKVSGCIGQLLNLKPIITMSEDGGYITHSKVRGFKQAFKALESIGSSYLEQGPCKIAIMTGTMQEEAEKLKEALCGHPNAKDIYVGQITPVVGIHSGPQLLAIAITSEK